MKEKRRWIEYDDEPLTRNADIEAELVLRRAIESLPTTKQGEMREAVNRVRFVEFSRGVKAASDIENGKKR